MIGDNCFPKSKRILRSKEYKGLWQEGQRYHTTHFVVLVHPGKEFSRLGITVSRKVGNAVYRNQLKRWIREYFRRNHTSFGFALDISVIAKRKNTNLSHAQVDRELLKVFARLETDYHD